MGGARSRGRTGTMLPSRDFKSRASAYSAIRAYESLEMKMEGGTGFEPVDGGFADHSVSHFAIRPRFEHLKCSARLIIAGKTTLGKALKTAYPASRKDRRIGVSKGLSASHRFQGTD